MRKLGLGCVTFGREIDADVAFDLMDQAYDNDIFDFDTAAVYSGGASEEIIGKWLKKNPSKAKNIKIATKLIPPFDTKSIIENVEKSLIRLGVDQIDLLYFHRWDEQLNNPNSWLALEELIAEGKINEIGASNFNHKQLSNAINLLQQATPLRIKAIQNNHNLAVSDLNLELVKTCRENNINIITFSPLGAGFLTGKHLLGVAKGSRFDLIPAHQQIYFTDEAQKALKNLLIVAKKTGYDPAFLALAWATHQPETTQVLIGGRSVSQLDFAIKASNFQDEALFKLLKN